MITVAMASKRKPRSVTDELRRAIAGSGVTLYQVAKDSDVEPSVIYRFMAGKQSLTLDTVDRLAAYLGLELKKKGR